MTTQQLPLHISQAFLFLLPAVVILLISSHYDAPKQEIAFDFLFTVFFLFTASFDVNYLKFAAILVYLCFLIQFISYYFFSRHFETAFLDLINLRDIPSAPIMFIIYIFLFIILLFIFVFYSYNFNTTRINFVVYAGIYFISQFFYVYLLMYHYNLMFPLDGTPKKIQDFPRMFNYFNAKTESVEGGNRKNIIIIQVESLELAFIGNYSKLCPGNMPFLTSLMNKGYFNPHVVQQKYVDYSAGALFGAECGLPLLRAKRGDVVGKSPVFFKNLHCVGNFLQKAGYYLEAQMGSTATETHYYGKILRDRGYNLTAHKNDDIMFDCLSHDVLPRLMKKTQPWVLYIETCSTHMNVLTGQNLARNKSCPIHHQYFDSTDIRIEKFYHELESKHILDNAEVFIYGDHRHLTSPKSYYDKKYDHNRLMAFWIPTYKKVIDSKKASTYDISWTIMDLAGIKVNPAWPWGKSLLNKGAGRVPTIEELSALHSYWDGQIGLGWEMKDSIKSFESWSPTWQGALK